MHHRKIFRFLIVLIAGLLVLHAGIGLRPVSAQEDASWQNEWAIETGFSISTDTSGYHNPTSLTFVPNPGSAPGDPLYFVTELQGTVKVVTNDRTVHIFAAGLTQQPSNNSLGTINDQGLTGLCLDPVHGYAFALVAIHSTNTNYTNHVIRFSSTPGTFSTEPTRQDEIAPMLETYIATSGHQINSCIVHDDLLYVSIGEGGTLAGSQDINQPFGKILRMTLEGQPAPGNPFYTDGDPTKVSNYVWVSGLRNSYGIKLLGDRIFDFDNGNNIDRLLEIKPGENYWWDGKDWSIGSNALTVLSPSLGPAQMDYYAAGGSLFPASYADTVFVASAGTFPNKLPGIVALPVDLLANRVTGIPRFFLQYRGQDTQYVAGLVFGPDALYFAPLLPDPANQSYIFKITYDPQHAHPYVVGDNSSALGIMEIKGCFNCHTRNHNGGSEGPALDRDVLVADIETRLGSDAYRQLVTQLDSSSEEPFISYRNARQQVLAASGLDQIRLWIEYHLQEPRFDNPTAHMPNLGLTSIQASKIADYLLQSNNVSVLHVLAKQLVPELHYDDLAIFFMLGLGVGIGLALAALLVWRATRAARKAQGKL